MPGDEIGEGFGKEGRPARGEGVAKLRAHEEQSGGNGAGEDEEPDDVIGKEDRDIDEGFGDGRELGLEIFENFAELGNDENHGEVDHVQRGEADAEDVEAAEEVVVVIAFTGGL